MFWDKADGGAVTHCGTDRLTQTDVQRSSASKSTQRDGNAESCTSLDSAAEQCENVDSGKQGQLHTSVCSACFAEAVTVPIVA